ncbi:MAG: DUF3883 domain-containing protein [Deltaproteobacteria bacterium]|nr:DUF3883 domain-containing protein [Deltaproteobacteria bacterium]
MASDYAAIRADNERRYGTDIGRIGPMLLADRYDDRTHFIFELLQNAEDALARRPDWRGRRGVTFHLSAAGLRVAHFGKLFDTLDVRGVCGIAESTKDLTAIGRFGIGFKSVYAFTDRPEVHSGAEDFAIENFVWPTAAPPVQRGHDETIFVLPPKANDGAARDEIAGGLKRLGPRTLLFLREIDEISWSVDGGPSGLYLRGAPEELGDNVRRLTLIGEGEGRTELEEHWLVFSQQVATPEDTHAGQVEIAFSIAQGKDSSRRSIQPVSDSPLVVFFPTVLPTHLGFLIQGPYRTTPSRDNVPRSDPWNQCLVEKSADLLIRSLRWLRDNGLLDAAAFRCLPLDRIRFGEGSMFAPLFEATRAALVSEPLLPRFGAGHAPAAMARLARTQELRALFDAGQVGRLFGHDGELAWLSADITQDRAPQVRQYLIQELGIPEITPEAILPRLDKSFLEEQSDDWIRGLYEFLNGQPALRSRLEKLPLVRLIDGSHVPARLNGQPRAFLQGAVETSFPTARRAVCSTAEAQKFLQSLGLTEPDPVDDVIHNVLPKYRDAEAAVSDATYDADVRRIVTAYGTDSKVQREKLVAALRETEFVKAIDAGVGSKSMSRPGDVYLATDRLKALFAGVAEVLLVDDAYACLRGDDIRTLLDACGAARYLQPVTVAPHFDWTELHAMRVAAGCKSSSGGDALEDFTLRGLENLLAALPRLDAEGRRARVVVLWEALGDVEDRRGASTFSGSYRWNYYFRRSATFDADFVRLLNATAWVPDSEGELQRPEFLIFDTLGWKADAFLVSKIRFKPPIIETLAREAGIEPAVLDRLKKLGITSEAELLARLGVEEQGESDHPEADEHGDVEPDEPDDEEAAAPSDPLDGASDTTAPGATGPASPGRGGGDGGGRAEGRDSRPGSGGDGGPRQRGDEQVEGDGEAGRKRAPAGAGPRPFVSYVAAHPDDDGPDPDGLDHQARMALEGSAIALILKAEPHLHRTPTHNPGYDLYESGPEDEPVRWIEVKAMKGELKDRPVGLSHTQFECAREHGEAYWLYVVERAGDGDARIVRIQDPAGRARTFTFDHGWIAVAEIAVAAAADAHADQAQGRAPTKEGAA